MAPRVIKLREQGEPRQETEAELPPQRKPPAVGRYLLQVDRQTRGSYGTAQAAEAVGMLRRTTRKSSCYSNCTIRPSHLPPTVI